MVEEYLDAVAPVIVDNVRLYDALDFRLGGCCRLARWKTSLA